jgi:biotin carboxylase
VRLSGSRGVIRADDRDEFIQAWERARRIVLREGESLERGELLVERYLPGFEVALEGLLTGGSLQTLALFDKPDPLEGPFFEETIYVTPSRLPEATQAAISGRTAEAAAALGLREGPIHAELRINDEGIWLIEMAGRSIGGLCSTVLEFGAGFSLEEIILRQAVGMPLPSTERTGGAAGVMMIPISKGGILREVLGQEKAAAVPGVTGVEITAPLNQPLTPLPEGASYLGFIFARGDSPEATERALRDAHARLSFRIEAAITLMAVG